MTANFPVGEQEDESPLEVESPWSPEHECVPLKQRLKMLRAKALSNNRDQIFISTISPVDDVVKKEDDSLMNMQDLHSDQDGSASCEQTQHGTSHAVEGSPFQDRMLSEKLDIEYTNAQDDNVTQLLNCQHPTSADDIEISEDFFDDLDHVVLRERQRMLLSRKRAGSSRPPMEHNSSDPSTNSADMVLQSAGKGSRGRDTCSIRSGMGGNSSFKKSDLNAYVSCETSESHLLNEFTTGAPTSTYQHQVTILTESQNYKNVHGANPCSSVRSAINEKRLLSSSCKTARTLASQPLPNVKSEPVDNDLEISNKDAVVSPCIGSRISVKSEHVNSSEIFEDILDHMMLGDRMRLLASGKFPKANMYENFENSKTFVASGNDHKNTLFESSKPFLMKRPRKKRKTVTDSIETALEEDAPGLLQVLIEKGVLVDEIKLYGETEGDEALDESLVEESFSELEDVITKIFSQRQSLLKFAPIKCARGEKSSYCLSCLVSLVEQARYLRARKWPVEWGWCRDLQSFIFVFEKHNRIVLERPEYGYATYFFELVDALPVHWQIKRLVTAMKLTSCSRITLIENRALTVGDDVTEGEARVLMEYGWIPNSGLGTMLNYYDRVVHDRKSEYESDSSEWRSKIGKLLTDGYNGGIIVPNAIPKKVMEYGVGQTQSPQIKLEY